MSGLFDFATQKCRYCGKEMKDMLMEKLSEKNCLKSPDGEHHFEDGEKREVKPKKIDMVEEMDRIEHREELEEGKKEI